MSFQALRSAVAAAQDGSDQYKTELMVLINYAAQCKAYTLPTLNQPPSWYPDAQTTWANLTGTLSGWAMSTLQDVTSQPTYLITQSTDQVLPDLAEAIADAQALVSNPGNNSAKSDLMGTLATLVTKFNNFSTTTTALVSSLENEATVFDTDAATMAALALQAYNQEGVDQAQVTSLQNDISQLQADIKSEIGIIVGGSVAAVAGLAMGGVAIGLAWVTGGASLFLLVPAILITAGGVAAITLASLAIENDKAKIQTDSTNISQLTADVTMLTTMQTTLTGFAGQVDQLKSALAVVVAPWAAAELYFSSTITNLQNIENATSQNWQDVVTELGSVQTEWNTLMGVMETLKLDANVSNATLSLGQTSAEVQSTMQSSTQVDLITYLSS